MALRSGELAKLKVPQETYAGVRKWLETAAAPGSRGSQYVYDPTAADTREKREGRRASPQMTSIGLLMRLYMGWDRSRPEMSRGADYLLKNPPVAVTSPESWYGAYYWYYATQVMFHMRGDHWEQWNSRLHPLLSNSQVAEGPLAGSWDPRGPASDHWGATFAGRIYVTTLNLLSLEVYYRHLPIYNDTAE